MVHDFPIALFVSYRGSTAEAVVRSSLEGTLKHAGVHVDLVISSSPDVEAIRIVDGFEGMKHGARLKLPNWRVSICDPRSGEYANEEAYGQALLKLCNRWKIQLICLFGWLGPLPQNVLKQYGGHILRQYCGPMDPGRHDFFSPDLVGPAVHAAVLWYHRALDDGTRFDLHPKTEVVTQSIGRPGEPCPIVGRTPVPIQNGGRSPKGKEIPFDSPTSLAARAIQEEHKLQIESILRYRQGELKPLQRTEPLIPDSCIPVLNEAKVIGRTLYPASRHLLPT